MMMNYKDRYKLAHQSWQANEYPAAYKDFGTLATQYPDVTTSNGLTRYILYFLKWSGWRATRVSSAGRIIKAPQKQISGISLNVNKFIPSTTRKGSADISATINGRSVMIEIKIGRDKPSEWQLKEQELERSSGGVYEFIHDADEFLRWYDQFIKQFI
jgi:hypothetical protein